MKKPKLLLDEPVPVNEPWTHAVVHGAIKSGRLIRPSECSECGRKAKIQGHHDDYNKPLDVRWLCYACHSIWHNHNHAIPSGRPPKWRIRPTVNGKRLCLTFDTKEDAIAALATIEAQKGLHRRTHCVLCGAEKKYDVEDKYGLVEG